MLKDFSKDSFKQLLKNMSATPTDTEESRCFRRLLLLADPEIVTALTEEQIRLIFQKNSPPEFRHLSNLISHYAKMSTLEKVISCLLSQFNDRFDEKQVVNFLCSAFCVSRLCPNADCGSSTAFLVEDPFELSVHQLMVLARYMLQEFKCACSEESGTLNRSSNSQISMGGKAALTSPLTNTAASLVISRYALKDRMDFFLLCCASDHRLKIIVKWIYDEWKNSSTDRSNLEQFLTEIYFKRPATMKWLENVDFLHHVEGVHSQESKVDNVLHQLLCDLEDKAKEAYSEQRMNRIKCVLYKFAAFHPTLFVRQLPLIAALLRGKTDFSMQLYSTTNYLLFYTIILDLLEFISPYAFDRHYVASFLDIMSSFLEFMQKQALKAISVRYPALTSLRSLVEQVTLPLCSVVPDWKTRKEVIDRGGEMKPSLVRAPSPVSVSEVNLLFSRLIKAQQTEGMFLKISDLLFEFEEKIKAKPDVLRYFKPVIEHLLSNCSESVRNTAFSLLLRYLYQDPINVECVITSVLRCLTHPDNAVAQTAMENLPDFIGICSDAYVGKILEAECQCCLRNVGESYGTLAESMVVLHNCC
ncbi:unnamed protein product [Soboliphyme baturini]|uniref:DUF2428 domain-containing protein n=1 Tax=Soboliphyme baturini TaxID=241478 RepID=A0A183IQR3_9BILA|nr:unnamed protein product [Soboliphyme baturini]